MQGNYLPESGPSPRLENGALYWFEGDNFTFQLDLSELQDQDGDAITLDPNEAELTVIFRDARERPVHTFAFGPEEDDQVENNCAALVFDDAATADFPKGRYTYRVELEYCGETKTLLRRGQAVVE